MELIGFIVLCATLCLGRRGAGAGPPPRAPPYMLLGTGARGDIVGGVWRCALHAPDKCELLYSYNSTVWDMLVHDEHLYTAHSNGGIRKCEWPEKGQCVVFHHSDDPVRSLVVTGGQLYAGLNNGVLLRCKSHEPHSCTTAHTFGSYVTELVVMDKYLYVVSGEDLFRCSKDTEINCIRVVADVGRDAHVASFGDAVITLAWRGELQVYNMTTNNTRLFGKTLPGYHGNIEMFGGIIYMVDVYGNIKTCTWDGDIDCRDFAKRAYIWRIAFAYGTHRADGAVARSSVFSYLAAHRAPLEAHVAAGKLVDSRGAPIDTRRADVGHSGRAVVFAMGPGGRLLVSAAHRSGLVDARSLLAGGPVASAGEMVVRDGVVERIVACSEHYRPDRELNRQVVHELRARGYTRAGEISLEECVYTCDRD